MKAEADSLARLHGWTGSWLEAGRFSLLAYAPFVWRGTGDLTVYIEGDGRSWISRTVLAADPTPRNGRVLKMAVRDPGDAAYLARPCHYLDAAGLTGCHRRYWSLARYGEDVVEAINVALDTLKQRSGARRLRLVGFSGGAQLAVLAAARRNDVAGIITIAGNLDHRRWTASQGVSALTGSLNAADVASVVRHIPQVHFLGELDTTVGRDVIESYLTRMSADVAKPCDRGARLRSRMLLGRELAGPPRCRHENDGHSGGVTRATSRQCNRGCLMKTKVDGDDESGSKR